MIIGYARVSTKHQNPDMQLDEFQKFGCEIIFQEKMSAFKERPEFERAMEHLRKDDVLFVWALDRLGRNLLEILTNIKRIHDKGASLRVYIQGIDTSNKFGKMLIPVFGMLAELEMDLKKERMSAGRLAATKRGRIGGRPRGLSEKAKIKAKQAVKLYNSQNPVYSIREISNMLNISTRTFYNYLKHEGVEPNINANRLGNFK